MSDTGLAGWTVGELRSAVQEADRDEVRLRVRKLELFAELDRRGFDSLGLRGLVDLIQVDLHCSRRHARRVATDVARFTGRVSTAGEPLEPVFPVVAAALASAALTFEHADVIGDVIDALPPAARAEHGGVIETLLVDLAADHDPTALGTLAGRIVAHLDPDGPEPADDRQHRQRRLDLSVGPDGTGLLRGHLSPECTAIWHTVLASLASTRQPSDKTDEEAAGDALGPDTRTRWQRFHDAFEHAGRTLLRTGQLPDHAGLPAQLLITIDLKDLEGRIGRATTHHGGTLTIHQALHLAADATIIPVILDQDLGLLAHGRGRRLASPTQRKAIFARDRGCTFPGCTRTAAESEIHHITDWATGGTTNPDNLTITCGYHNNEAPRQGWKTTLIHGTPHWTPPPWRDPHQQPRRNWTHHPELLLQPPQRR